ncbi:MAG: nucleoside/nucleotide kinase family protein [Galbitalea sp.]
MTTLRSLSEVAATISAAAGPQRRTLVGLAGAPGAGKSTIAEALVDLLGPTAALLPMDGFHLPQATLRALGRRDRMGAPDTFDVEGFLATLTALRAATPRSGAGGDSAAPVLAPGFDREREEPVPDAIAIARETATVIVEGNYLLLDSGGWGRAAALLDLTFFVAVDHDLRLRRLIARHERFGKTAAQARAWALGPDERNAELVEATAARADHRIELG